MGNEEQKDVSSTDQGVYFQALEKAKKELASQREERQKIDIRIAKLEQTVKGLAAICEEQQAEIPPDLPLPPEWDTTGLGLTSAIRKILSSRGTAMVPTEIRDALVDSGTDLSRYSNAMVAIHNTLKRLFDQGELARSKDEPTRYQWVNMIARIVRESERTMNMARATNIPKDFEMR